MIEYSNAYLSHAIPPLFLLIFYFYRDRFKEPFRYVLASFFLGASIIYPLGYLIILADYFGAMKIQNDLTFLFYNSFFRAAYLEEGLKFLIIFFFCTKLPEFNEKYDALIYSAAVGLGYAGIENIGYLEIYGSQMMDRIYPLFVHLGLALTMGLFLSKALFNKLNTKLCIFLSLCIPVLIHGLHNTLASNGSSYTTLGWLFLLAINYLFIIFMFFYARHLQKHKIIEAEIKTEIADKNVAVNYLYVLTVVFTITLMGEFITI